jgi:CheY-like chemotaxis protein
MASPKNHVLVVDDDPDVREALEALLSSSGFNTTSSSRAAAD